MVKFAVFTDADRESVETIVDRARALEGRAGRPDVRKTIDIMMDLAAVHAHTPLRLAELAAADDFNFAHDMFGIERHLNRETGELMDCFVPRFAAK